MMIGMFYVVRMRVVSCWCLIHIDLKVHKYMVLHNEILTYPEK